MKIIKSTIRLFVYLGIIGVFMCLVFWKQNVIRTKRAKKIVSSVDEWKQNGKPVKIEKIKLKDVKVYTKITLFHTSKNACEGFVPKAVKEKLKVGQTGYSIIGEKEKIEGSIINIADEADLDNGMFLIKSKIDQEIDATNAKVIATIHTDTYKNVINVANEAIDTVDGKHYIWKVINGLAKRQESFATVESLSEERRFLGEIYATRQEIKVEKQDGYGAIVVNGLNEKDLVIVEGQFLLKETDKVLIVDGDEGLPKGKGR